MPGNDDLDPLDAWLQQEITPLAPPEGTFEAISTRARRRKVRKLAATASAAVAVAAAVILAGPAVTSFRPAASSDASSGRTATQAPATTAAPSATATRTPSPSSSPAATVAAGTRLRGQLGSSLPASFQPTSATFVSSSHGWVLGHSVTGSASCGTGACVSIVATTDGGRTWSPADAPQVAGYRAGGSGGGVSSLRYLDGTNGWLYGPDLWSTHDGGQTWTKVNTGGDVVVDLAASSGRAFAIFATCTSAAAASAITSYGRSCGGFTLESAPAGSDQWAPVGRATTGLAAAKSLPSQPAQPSIVFGDKTGWLLGPQGDLYSGSMYGGAWRRVSATPCTGSAAPAAPTPSLLSWKAPQTLLQACDPHGASTAARDIFLSTDGGRTWTRQAAVPTSSAVTSITNSQAATDILATSDGIMYLPAGGGTWRQATGTPAGGFSFVGTTNPSQGVAVPTTVLNRIYMTYDGGQTWHPYTVGSG